MLAALKNKKVLVYAFIGIVTVIYTALLFNLINRHSVNLLFMDQWDFTDALFGNPTAWGLFSRQHGPHRQGIGAFVNLIIGTATDWNMRAEAFAIGGILILTAFAALYLKYRLFGKLTFWDALIPAVCLSFIQCEIAFPNTNPGYTALPLLLIILTGITLTFKNPAARYSLLAVANFFAVFTGFSLFLGPVVSVVLIFAIVIHGLKREKRETLLAIAALIASLLTLALFFTDYTFAPAVDCFQFPHPQPYEYLVYISNMLTMCQGFLYGSMPLFARRYGIILFGVWGLILLYQFWLIFKKRDFSPVPLVNFLFLSFSIGYALNTAVGRVCLGIEQARSTRYMTLLIPGWLAIYFSVLLLKSDVLRRGLLIVLIFMLIVLPLRQYKKIDQQFFPMTEARQKWAACYLEKENIEECDRFAGIQLHPNAEITHLKEKLNILKQNRYNLFSSP